MKKMFKEAHKMTKEIVNKYGVDYKTQFGLCLAYLLENKEERKMEELKKVLNGRFTSEEEKQIIETIEKLNRTDLTKAETKCIEDAQVRKIMNNSKLYTYEYGAERNYLGEGIFTTKNYRVWSNYGKTRIYFDMYIDGIKAYQTFIDVK